VNVEPWIWIGSSDVHWLILIIPAVLLYRVFCKSVSYAVVPRKTKILHALALLFLYFFFLDVPDWIYCLVGWPIQTVSDQFVSIGFFSPALSLFAFFVHVVTGLFVVYCTFALAWGVHRWRKLLVKIFPVLVLVIALDNVKASQLGVPMPAIVIFSLLFSYILAMIYLFYSRPYSDALFEEARGNIQHDGKLA
jgi:hypothetical protein